MAVNQGRRTCRLLLAVLCGLGLATAAGQAQNAPAPQPQGQQAPPAQGQRQGGGMADRFAGQPRIKALMVAGGCCHDYPTQGGMLMKMLQTELPIDWNFVYTGGTAGQFLPALYNDPTWFRGYDLVVHNECFTPADSLVSDQYLANAAAATRAGVPAVVIHCAMHTFRAEPADQWRGILGVHSMRHERAAPINVRVAAAQHPIMAGIQAEWTTPIDELYVLERMLPGTVPLAIAKSPVDGREHAVAWTNESGARIFGTTLGHGNDTWNDPVYQQLLKQGVRWALKR
jgi:uncharacterized protein